MVAVVRETERKYEFPSTRSGLDVPDLSDVPSVASVRDDGVSVLDALYYDTADRRLASEGITLRCRTGDDAAGWHLKMPVARGVRDEFRAPLHDQLPKRLTALVRSRVRHWELVPVMRLRSQRHVRSLLDTSGAVLAEVVRDQVLAERQPGGERAEWAEIEVELGAGQDPGILAALDQRLTAAGLLAAGEASKLERALAETGVHGPRSQHRTHSKKKSPQTAGEVVLEYVGTQVRALIERDPAVRRREEDAVHQMRVATRRLRSCFRSYRKVLDRSATTPLGTELQWLAAELGVDRDREVLTARLSERVGELPRGLRHGPVAGRLRSYDRARRGGSHRRLQGVLDSERYLRLLDALEALLAEPPLQPGADRRPERVLQKAVSRDFDRVARRVERVLAAQPGAERDSLAHGARKAAKRARYAAEAARPVFGKRATSYVRRMVRLQDLLGLHQDTVVTRAALLDLASEAESADEPSFSYGVLYEREERLGRECVEQLPELWGAVAEHRKLR